MVTMFSGRFHQVSQFSCKFREFMVPCPPGEQPSTPAPPAPNPSTAGPEPNPTTPGPAPTCQKLTWINDGYCDDETNTPECFYDGHDCCVQKRDNWDRFCEVCIDLDLPDSTIPVFEFGQCFAFRMTFILGMRVHPAWNDCARMARMSST